MHRKKYRLRYSSHQRDVIAATNEALLPIRWADDKCVRLKLGTNGNICSSSGRLGGPVQGSVVLSF